MNKNHPHRKLSMVLFITTLFLTISVKSIAQINSIADAGATVKTDDEIYHPLNFIKLNLTAIVVKNYSLQYERVLNKKMSLAFSYRVMPSASLPFKSTILQIVGNDPDTKATLNDLKLSNFAITPELRFYVGKKGWGQGFYIAPFYRYASFKTNSVKYTYTTTVATLNVQENIIMQGKLTSNTGGLLIGVQKGLGKNICIDIWIFGPHYGAGTGNFNGTSPRPLTQPEQDALKNKLESLDIPLARKTVVVTATEASLKLDGPWGGIRSGLCLGIKF